MLVTTHRACTFRSPSALADEAVLALALASKNLRNAELFVLRNVMTAYQWNADTKELVLKKDLHDHQRACLAALNLALEQLSAERAERMETDKAKFESLVSAIGSNTLNRALANSTVLTRAVRLHQSSYELPDFTALPAVFAHPVSAHIATMFKATLQARIQYFRDKKAGAEGKRGLPSLPSYLGKNERSSFVLDANYLGKELSLPKLSAEKHNLRTSFGGAELGQEAIAAWNALRLGPVLDAERLKLARRLEAKGVHLEQVRFRQLRFVVRDRSVKWEAVFEVQVEERADSALGRFRSAYEASRGEKSKAFDALAPSKQDELLLDYVKANASSFKVVAGLDPGLVNHATLAVSTGRHRVFSGQRMNAWLTRRAERLDSIKSLLQLKLIPEALRAKLAANRAEPDKTKRVALSRDEKVLLARATSELHAHPEYVACLTRTQRSKSNYLHQLSSAIIDQCARQGVEVLVIGRNKGWKDELEMGRKANRLFTSIAHYELVERLKYKGAQLGLIVVDTEESYTSKMSFVHADPLPVHARDEKKSAPQGVREGTFYKLKTRPDGVLRDTVHADLNGALNIIRKAVESFCFKPGFALSFSLRGFDGRWQPFYRGLAPSAG